MKYIANAAWRHEEPIDGERMIDYSALVIYTFDAYEHCLETNWYQIDQYTHRSVAVFKSEQDCQNFKDKHQIQGDFSFNEIKVSILSESMGPAFAVASDLTIERN